MSPTTLSPGSGIGNWWDPDREGQARVAGEIRGHQSYREALSGGTGSHPMYALVGQTRTDTPLIWSET